MDLTPDHGKHVPGYPTLDEYALTRRAYLKRMAGIAGAVAIAGVDAFCAEKPRVRLTGTAPVPPRHYPDTTRRLLGKPQPVSNDSEIKTGARCLSDTGTSPGFSGHDQPRPRGKMQPAELRRLKGTQPKPLRDNSSPRCITPGDSVKSSNAAGSINDIGKMDKPIPPTGGVPMPPVKGDSSIVNKKQKRP
jgi:hypothetical protein